MPFLKNVAMQVSRSYTPYTPEQRELWVWGENTYGLTGDNKSVSSLYTLNLGTGWATGSNKILVPGSDSILAIKADGTLWAVGYNQVGQLGLNDTVTRSSPVQVGNGADWNYIFGHPYNKNVFALKTDGTLWVWGENYSGTLGNNANTPVSSPIQIGTDAWSKIAPGLYHTLGLKQDGTLWAWGYNFYGTVGDSTNTDRSSPVQIGTLNTWTDIGTSGETSHAVRSDGTLWSWGRNTYGNLGLRLSSSQTRVSPTQVGLLTNWSTIFSQTHLNVFVTKTDGTLWGWGNNATSVLGDGTTTSRSSPIQIAASGHGFIDIHSFGNSGVTTVANFSIGIKSDGSIWAWGDSTYIVEGGINTGVNGPVFNQTFDPNVASLPVQIGSYNNIKAIASGQDVNSTTYGNRFIVVNSDGELLSAGFSRAYDVAFEGLPDVSAVIPTGLIHNNVVEQTPKLMGDQSDWDKVSIGDFHVAAIKNGTLWTWGLNSYGQLGVNDTINRSSPTQVGADTSWVDAAAGFFTTFAIKADGTLWSWGGNTLGILGIRTDDFLPFPTAEVVARSSPVQVGTDTDWVSVKINVTNNSQYGGARNNDLTPYAPYALALKTNGTLWGWGYSFTGALPGLNYACRFQPHNLTGVSKLASNTEATFAIKTDGTLWSLGGRNVYNLQAGSTTSGTSSPIQIGSNTWKSIAGINSAGFAIRSDDTLWTWGAHSTGRLGLNLASGLVSSPVQIGTSTWSSLSATNPASNLLMTTMHAIRSDGTLWGWGGNTNGNIGDNTTTNRSSPVQIGSDTDWARVATSVSYALAVKTNGTLWGWGYNAYGSIGNGSNVNTSSPVQIGSDTNWSKVFIAGVTSFGIKTDGTLWAWGFGSNGYLGDGTTIDKSSPVQVGSDTDWDHVSSAFTSETNGTVRAQKTDGSVYAWGYGSITSNGISQTPTSDLTKTTPEQIESDRSWATGSIIGFGNGIPYGGFMILDTNNKIYYIGGGRTSGAGLARTHGNGAGGFITSATHVQRPRQIAGSWVMVDAGVASGVGIKSDGTLWAWGAYGTSGHFGPAGMSTANTVNYIAQSPIQIGNDNTWATATIGDDQIFAIKTNGTLWAIGRNTYGTLGVNDTTPRSSPTQIGTGTNWKKVKTRYFNTLAVKTDGTLWGWGANHTFMINSPASTRISSPVQIGNDTNWSDIDLAFGNYAAIRYISGSV